jgi:glycogen debranching enzyme
MFVISLANRYAWQGVTSELDAHWDAARRVMDWAREYGDVDGDGYLEYSTKYPEGPQNQGWKDSGDAMVYEDGTIMKPPLADCEIQGYWFAAQQLMAAMCLAKGKLGDAKDFWKSAAALKKRFNRDWWLPEENYIALAMGPDKRPSKSIASNAGHCLATGIVDDKHIPALVERMFAPDMFSGWGIRTLSTEHPRYNPLSYHRGSIWLVENATIAFGLRRFGFDERALELARAMFSLSQLYDQFRVPETIGGYARSERPFPGAYPRANTLQAWNASAMPLLLHTILGLQPVARLDLLVADPVLPTWMPEVRLKGLRVGGATATIRFWRDKRGKSHVKAESVKGTLHIVRQPPPESMTVGWGERVRRLVRR